MYVQNGPASISLLPWGLHTLYHISLVLVEARGDAVLAVFLQLTSLRRNCLRAFCLNEVSSHDNQILSADLFSDTFPFCVEIK